MRLVERGYRRLNRLRETKRNLEILAGPDAGKIFVATINRNNEFDLPSPIGNDKRGKSTIEIAKDLNLNFPDQCKLKDTESGEFWTMVDLDFNCPSYSVKYVLELKSSKDN